MPYLRYRPRSENAARLRYNVVDLSLEADHCVKRHGFQDLDDGVRSAPTTARHVDSGARFRLPSGRFVCLEER